MAVTTVLSAKTILSVSVLLTRPVSRSPIVEHAHTTSAQTPPILKSLGNLVRVTTVGSPCGNVLDQSYIQFFSKLRV